MKRKVLCMLLMFVFIQYSIAANIDTYIPRDRYAFHHSYHNEGGVCLLASYACLLEWANSYPEQIWPYDNYNVFSEYLKFHNTLEPIMSYSPEQIRIDRKDKEKYLSHVMNNYCRDRFWSGYVQVERFHNWLKLKTNWVDNIEVVARLNLENRSAPLVDAYQKLQSYFRNNIQSGLYDYIALVVIGTSSGPHSILLGYDNQGFFCGILILQINYTILKMLRLVFPILLMRIFMKL